MENIQERTEHVVILRDLRVQVFVDDLVRPEGRGAQAARDQLCMAQTVVAAVALCLPGNPERRVLMGQQRAAELLHTPEALKIAADDLRVAAEDRAAAVCGDAQRAARREDQPGQQIRLAEILVRVAVIVFCDVARDGGAVLRDIIGALDIRDPAGAAAALHAENMADDRFRGEVPEQQIEVVQQVVLRREHHGKLLVVLQSVGEQRKERGLYVPLRVQNGEAAAQLIGLKLRRDGHGVALPFDLREGLQQPFDLLPLCRALRPELQDGIAFAQQLVFARRELEGSREAFQLVLIVHGALTVHILMQRGRMNAAGASKL